MGVPGSPTARSRSGVPVLMYHSLSDGACPDREYGKYTVTTTGFRSQIEALRAAGYSLASVADLVAHVRGTGSMPERTCVLTFDDGHRSSLEMASILEQNGARGTFYLTADYCRRRSDFLGPDEVLAIAAMGHEIGGHGATHRSLRHLPEAEMRREIDECKDWLESILGHPPVSMSVPAGQFDERVTGHAFAVGFAAVGTSLERRNVSPELHLVLGRYVVLRNHSADLVRRIADGSWAYDFRRRIRSGLLRLPKALLRSFNRVRQ